jgi:anti-sigma factor RsiW
LNCERFEALLTDYLEGTLPKEDKAAMDQHMEECAASAKSLSDMRMLLQDLTGMDDSAQVPAEWSQSWRQVIRTEERTNMLKQSETPRRKPWRAWIGAVAAVAVLAAGSMAAREWIPAAGQPQASNSSIALQKSADTSEGMPLPAPGGAADMLYAATPEASGATRNSAAYSGAQSMKEEAAPAAGETVQGVKIIRTASYTLNTMQFEKDLESVKALASAYNGWVEYAGVTGDAAQGDMRYANLTLRIPTDSLDSFESGVNHRPYHGQQ